MAAEVLGPDCCVDETKGTLSTFAVLSAFNIQRTRKVVPKCRAASRQTPGGPGWPQTTRPITKTHLMPDMLGTNAHLMPHCCATFSILCTYCCSNPDKRQGDKRASKEAGKSGLCDGTRYTCDAPPTNAGRDYERTQEGHIECLLL